MNIEAIAHIRTDFPEKFGIPRQSGLAEGVEGRIVFEPEYRNPDALRGLEGFDYIWLIWEFSVNRRRKDSCTVGSPMPGGQSYANVGSSPTGGEAGAAVKVAPVDEVSSQAGERSGGHNVQPAKGWQPTVRPPRLGGNRSMGVFATRSPFRPNPLGLSSVRIERVELDTPDGPVIVVRGADLMDGTPIYDIKPYIRYADSHADAACGYVDTLDERHLEVVVPDSVKAEISTERLQQLAEVLALDPRPSYQDDPDRIYGLSFGDLNVRFTVSCSVLTVVSITSI